MSEGVWVKVRNFRVFKGRTDNQFNSWFRCSNRLLEDPDFFEFTHAEILVWIHILSLASQKNSETIFINYAHADRVCRLKKRVVVSAIQKLQVKQLDPLDDTSELLTGNLAGTHKGATRHNITDKTDITNKHADPDESGHRREFDFDSLYFKYPRKEGKSQGYRVLAKDVQTEADFAAVSTAIDRYRKHITASGTDPKFIKHFSTFMNHWRDWLDPSHGTAEKLGNNGSGFDWEKYEREKAEQGAL